MEPRGPGSVQSWSVFRTTGITTSIMSIRRRETQIPTEGFPPAKLYLDDMREIIEIFRESTEYKTSERNKDEPERLVFECDDKSCETLEDLQTIGAKTVNFVVTFDLQGVAHELTIHTTLIFWRFYGLKREGGWDTYFLFQKDFACFGPAAATFRPLPQAAPGSKRPIAPLLKPQQSPFCLR